MKDKLRQKLKTEYETPETPFDEWAAQRGIVTDSAETVELLVYEPAENVSGSSVSKNNKKRILCISIPIVAFLAGLVILLVCLLPRPNPSPIIFGVDDSEKIEISIEEILEREDVYLYDMTTVGQSDAVYKDVLLEDNSRVMLYTIQNSLLSVENGESYDGFYLTYQIRTYAYYEFFSFGNYSELNKEVVVNGKNIEYRIDEFQNAIGYAKFTVGDYDYFIEARGYDPITVLNEDNFLNLLDKILI